MRERAVRVRRVREMRSAEPAPHRRTRISLWLPLTPFFWMLAPVAMLLAPLILLAPPLWRMNPYVTAYAIGRVLILYRPHPEAPQLHRAFGLGLGLGRVPA